MARAHHGVEHARRRRCSGRLWRLRWVARARRLRLASGEAHRARGHAPGGARASTTGARRVHRRRNPDQYRIAQGAACGPRSHRGHHDHADRRSRDGTRARMMRLGSLAALALGMAGLGCQASAAALVYTPYQGVNIDSSSLVAPYGCGMGPGQVYRYVATLVNVPIVDGGDASDASRADAGPGTILTTGVFDCFADGVFQGTPPAPATFALTIYALTYPESVAAGL